MSDGQSQPKAPPTRWLLWTVLIVSLVFNGVVVGIIVGHSLAGFPSPSQEMGRRSDFVYSPMALFPLMSEETRRVVWRENPPKPRVFRMHIRLATKNRLQVIEAMKADPFDETAYRAAIEAAKKTDDDGRKMAIELLVKTVKILPTQERIAIAEQLEERLKNRKMGPHKGGRMRPGGPGGMGPGGMGPGRMRPEGRLPDEERPAPPQPQMVDENQ